MCGCLSMHQSYVLRRVGAWQVCSHPTERQLSILKPIKNTKMNLIMNLMSLTQIISPTLGFDHPRRLGQNDRMCGCMETMSKFWRSLEGRRSVDGRKNGSVVSVWMSSTHRRQRYTSKTTSETSTASRRY